MVHWLKMSTLLAPILDSGLGQIMINGVEIIVWHTDNS